MKKSKKTRPIPKKKNSKKSTTTKVLNADKLEVYKPTKKEKAEFDRLNKIVTTSLDDFGNRGEALAKIHAEILWRAGGYDCWKDYCHSVLDMTPAEANRLINASQCLTEIREISDFELWPVSESQVIPLLKLNSAKQRWHAWDAAVTSANYKQPRAKDVKEMVSSILKDDLDGNPLKKKPLTKSKQREKIMSKLRRVVAKKKSWEEVKKLLEDLEKLL